MQHMKTGMAVLAGLTVVNLGLLAYQGTGRAAGSADQPPADHDPRSPAAATAATTWPSPIDPKSAIPNPKSPASLRVRRLELIDDAGRVRAVLGLDDRQAVSLALSDQGDGYGIELTVPAARASAPASAMTDPAWRQPAIAIRTPDDGTDPEVSLHHTATGAELLFRGPNRSYSRLSESQLDFRHFDAAGRPLFHWSSADAGR